MTTIVKTYKVNQKQQLIDLNGNSVNFEIKFTATSKNGELFEMVVVDQKILNENLKPNYKKSNDGKLVGTIVSDKNVYQNYFLIIRAPQECEVQITIEKKEIQPRHSNQHPPNQHPPNQYLSRNSPINHVNQFSSNPNYRGVTPNQNGVNDVFKPVVSGVRDFKMMIYDRWGGKISEINDESQGWDGNVNGLPAQDGVYVYYIEFKDYADKIYQFSGTIHLLR